MFGDAHHKGSWLLLALLVVIAYLLLRGPNPTALQVTLSSPAIQPVGDLPVMIEKPEPEAIALEDCPPQGEGGDNELNLWKNRVDSERYVSVSFDSVLALTWPKSVEGKMMKDWPAEGRAFIQQYQGIPVKMEGYIIRAWEGTPEPANCSRPWRENLNWHLYFARQPGDERSQAILAEVTPRVRQSRRWTLDLIRAVILDDHLPTRLSGWLFFDPLHPNDVGRIRATLWEITPVMQIEVFKDGRWLPLDRFAN